MSCLRLHSQVSHQLCAPSCSFAPAAALHTATRARSATQLRARAARRHHAAAAGSPVQRACAVTQRTSVVPRAVGTEGGMAPHLKTAIDNLIQNNKVVVFMKGTKEFPQCGFSNTVVQILASLDAPFESVNILENEMLRGGMKEYSQWPTFPQVYVDGEFYGGCDIMIEAFQSGELKETLERVLNE